MNLPLSDILRPKNFAAIKGQNDSVSFLKTIISSKKPLSLLFFGPPGCGKTTLARLYAQSFDSSYVSLSAVFSSVSDIKKIVSNAKENKFFNQPTILFVDEIHRFNKAQQDSFLPFIENGTIILIGATTQNPSFSLNNALISRLRILSLNPLKEKDLDSIISSYENSKKSFKLNTKAKKYIIELSSGDARHLINMIENIESLKKFDVKIEDIEKIIQKKAPLYDKTGEEHFNLISALHSHLMDPAQAYGINGQLLPFFDLSEGTRWLTSLLLQYLRDQSSQVLLSTRWLFPFLQCLRKIWLLRY